MRHHLFSHYELLQVNRMVLEDVFTASRQEQEPVFCRFELHRDSESVLQPLAGRVGLAAYERLMVPSPAPLPSAAWHFSPIEDERASSFAGLYRLVWDPALPFALASLFAGDRPVFWVASEQEPPFYPPLPRGHRHIRCFLPENHGWCPDGMETQIFEGGYEQARLAVAGLDESWCELGCWGNPFRRESLKVLGLDLIHRFRGQKPAVVLLDSSGELLMALATASAHYQTYFSDLPFRLILVQFRPWHAVCSAFEGSEPDFSPWIDRYPVQIPRFGVDPLVSILHQHQGTAIALDPGAHDADPFEPALFLLRRTGFLDDEDLVVLLDADGNSSL